MRGTMRARVPVAGVLALVLVVAAAAGPAAAEPAAEPARQTTAGSTTVDPAVVSLAAERGVTAAEAKRRIGWQYHASGLADEMAPALGAKTFGGVWIGADDRVTMGVVGDAAALAGARGALATRAGARGLDADATTVVPVPHSLAELITANDWLSAQLKRVDPGTRWPLQAGYSTGGNVVHLGVPPDVGQLTPDQQAVVDEARQRFGDLLSVYTYVSPPTADACRWPYCDPPLRAGVRYYPQNCTTGFMARGRSSGNWYAITAGHCLKPVSPSIEFYSRFADDSLHHIGPRHDFVFSFTADAGILRVTHAPGWQPRAWVLVTDGAGADGVPGTEANGQYPIYRDGTSSEGMRVCKSGATGGSFCGTVRDLGVTQTYDGVTVGGLVQATYCREHGDSGGPVFAENTAYGIHVSGHGCFAYYQGIREAENLLNVDVAYD